MDMSIVHSVENEDRPNFKIVSVKPSDGNPNFALYITLKNVVYLEDIENYLNCKFESIGSEYMNKDMELVFNLDMIMKLRFEHLKELDLFKYHLYHELDTNECSQITLLRLFSAVHLWVRSVWLPQLEESRWHPPSCTFRCPIQNYKC